MKQHEGLSKLLMETETRTKVTHKSKTMRKSKCSQHFRILL